MTMLAEKGHWVGTEERQPAAYGRYRVICVQRGQRTEDDYLWNGSYWVTPKGSPSKGVQSWWEQKEETLPKSSQPAQPGRVMTLADYEARIHLYKEQIGTGYIGIGRTLLEAKEAKVVPHGQWETWVTETTGLTARQAQRCMQAATEIKDGSALARLEMSKALMLLGSGLDEEAREEIAEKAAEEGATVKDLREQLRQAKLKLVQETGAAVEIREALKKAEEERDQIEGQMRARENAYHEQLDEAREDAYKRGEMAGGADAAARIREMEKKQFGLQNEANKQRQYAEELRKLLDEKEEEYQWMLQQCDEEARAEEREKMAAAVPADFAKDREILLAAAEDAERRAADAEAELEALRAGGAGQPEPIWKVLKIAADRFMTDCEMMPLDPAALISDRNRISASVNWIGSWVDMMRKALDAAVPAEGAVE